MLWLIPVGLLLLADALIFWIKGWEYTLSVALWRWMKLPIISAIFGVLIGHVVSPLGAPVFGRTGNQIVITGFLALSLIGSFYPSREITRYDRFVLFIIGFILGLFFWPR